MQEIHEVRIVFRDVDGKEIGDEISIDAGFSKQDLNKMLD